MACRVGRPYSTVTSKTAESGRTPKTLNQDVLKKGAKRDPELYVGWYPGCPKLAVDKRQILLTIMTGAFGMAGFFFGTR